MVQPGACSPSRSVVSKTRTRSTSAPGVRTRLASGLTVRRPLGGRLAHATARAAPWRETPERMSACCGWASGCVAPVRTRRVPSPVECVCRFTAWRSGEKANMAATVVKGARRGPRAARASGERSLSEAGERSVRKRPLAVCREGPFATDAPRYSVRPPMHEIPRPIIIIRPRAVLRRRTLRCGMVSSVYAGLVGRQG